MHAPDAVGLVGFAGYFPYAARNLHFLYKEKRKVQIPVSRGKQTRETRQTRQAAALGGVGLDEATA